MHTSNIGKIKCSNIKQEHKTGAEQKKCDQGVSTDLELHGCVFLILWCGVALVVEVVGSGGVDDGRLLRGLVEPLAVHIHQEGQQAGTQEARHTRSYQVKQSEPWGKKRRQY